MHPGRQHDVQRRSGASTGATRTALDGEDAVLASVGLSSAAAARPGSPIRKSVTGEVPRMLIVKRTCMRASSSRSSRNQHAYSSSSRRVLEVDRLHPLVVDDRRHAHALAISSARFASSASSEPTSKAKCRTCRQAEATVDASVVLARDAARRAAP